MSFDEGGETSESNTGDTLQEMSKTMQDKAQQVKNKASVMGSQFSKQVEFSREKAAQALQHTSTQLDKVAQYMKDNTTNTMMQDLYQVARRHPGKTALIIASLYFLAKKKRHA